MSKKKILVVDDDTETTNIFNLALNKLGYEASVARNVPDAHAYLENNTPDVILLDIMMPGQSGLDLLVQIRETPHLAGIYVIIISAHAYEDNEVPDNIEPDAILRKPIRIPDLRQVLTTALA
jgi:CheY-like chemotaxis protein